MLTISKDHCLVFCHRLELKIAPINHPQSTYFLIYIFKVYEQYCGSNTSDISFKADCGLRFKYGQNI